MIYLDNCATTKPRKEVVEAMVEALEEDFYNPSGLHTGAVEVEKKKEAIREQIKSYFHCVNGELYFTSGATESNNTALNAAIREGSGKNVVTTNVEHPSILNVLKEKDIEVRKVAIDRTGHISLEALLDAIDEETMLVSLFHVNNELGSINDVAQWVPAIKERYPRIKVHIDGVQAVGKLPVDFDRIGCDSYSFSGHKFHGPKGIGGLIVAKHMAPFILGGGQEMGIRSGTENIPGIYGLSAAFKALDEEGIRLKEAKARVDYLRRGIEEIDDVRINTSEPASPYILNVSIDDTRGEVLLHMLEEKEIYISTSSACSSHRTGKNPVLEALGLSESLAQGTIRLCLSRETTREELDVFIRELKDAVSAVRDIIRR
ncbi:MAG: cysteine desulfurase family protein [Peptoniphilus sp.]|nr:cysteine desulfurase family protein [Peptoniphilus sp.]MDD7362705.1 cysteine desulfurase family protein [Bacillota bacterium]MDY6044896.1 cysteine desulfurase family protein [Peptoniphilus sp.]